MEYKKTTNIMTRLFETDLSTFFFKRQKNYEAWWYP